MVGCSTWCRLLWPFGRRCPGVRRAVVPQSIGNGRSHRISRLMSAPPRGCGHIEPAYATALKLANFRRPATLFMGFKQAPPTPQMLCHIVLPAAPIWYKIPIRPQALKRNATRPARQSSDGGGLSCAPRIRPAAKQKGATPTSAPRVRKGSGRVSVSPARVCWSGELPGRLRCRGRRVLRRCGRGWSSPPGWVGRPPFR